jgi:hypothetical protein
VEKSNLGDVESHVLNLNIVWSFRKGDLEEGIYCCVADHPVEGLQNVPFHLSEHLVIV